ncbi:MAG: potassium transporter, partial [Rhodocyclales bacterium]|nr:potassium transporter [Rhodocyclales bacterium]
ENLGAFFMILSGVNFALHFMVWHGRSLRPYLLDEENLFYLGIIGLALVLVALLLVTGSSMPLGPALRLAFFQVATFITNTGLSSSDYYNWPVAAQVLLLFISIVGGCAGSTAGGIKVMRFMLLLKQGNREVQLLIHPQAVIPIKLGNRSVDARVTSAVWAFFAVYIAVFALFMLILTATGMNQETAFSAVVGTINNLGLGLGEVSSGFGAVTDTGKWTLVLSMLMGRLELFTVLVLFSPRFWRS